jgi:hypothetical protein
MKIFRWQWSLQTYFLLLSLFACAFGGCLARYQWRNQLFAELESIGNQPAAACRVTTVVQYKWFGLFGADFSYSTWFKEKPWWIEPTMHRYAAELVLYVADSNHPACKSILNQRESLRGLTSLALHCTDIENSLVFPKHAARLPDVRKLSLTNVSLTKEDIVSISRMPDLEILELSRSHLRVEDLAELRSSENLAWLILAQEITPKSVEAVREQLANVFVTAFPTR